MHIRTSKSFSAQRPPVHPKVGESDESAVPTAVLSTKLIYPLLLVFFSYRARSMLGGRGGWAARGAAILQAQEHGSSHLFNRKVLLDHLDQNSKTKPPKDLSSYTADGQNYAGGSTPVGISSSRISPGARSILHNRQPSSTRDSHSSMMHNERPMRWSRPRLGIMFKSLAGNMVPEDVARV